MKTYTKRELEAEGYVVENNVLKEVNINIIAHFGNVSCLELVCENVVPMSGYNNTQNLGFLLKNFVELLGIEQEDGIRLSAMKNIPIRLVFESPGGVGSKCIGFGNFMKDKFVLTSEFSRG